MSLRSGVCPNCEATEVHHDGAQLVLSKPPIRVGLGGTARRVQYVCTACGLVEDFVDPAGARLIRAKWPRVEPTDDA
jgi:hypothetical protein